MAKESRHLAKGKAEQYPDPTKFDDFGPMPKDEDDADDHKAARYAADAELKAHFSNINHRTNRDARNIAQVQGRE